MKKSIALVWPKATFLSANDIWPPLGLLYLSSRLESMGHKTEFFDLNMDEMPKDGDFDYLFLSCTSPQIREARRIGLETSGWKTKRVLGGALSWANPESAKTLNFNLVVGGEADYPKNIELVLDTLEHSKDNYILLPNPQGLEWVLPPNRRWINKYNSYMKDWYGNTHRMMSIFGARGCALHCAFCESSSHGIIWSRLTRYEPLWCIEKQLQEAVGNGHSGIAWYDDVFILNKRRTLEILNLLKKYNLVWRCFLRSDILCKHGGKEYLQQMKDAGLIEIFVGVESADNQIKNNIHKGTTVEQDTAVLKWCKELDITCKMSFIVGLPGESFESLEKTRKWILENRPHRTQVDRLIPFPGTPLYDHAELYDLKYEKQVDEEFFYKGRMDLDSHSFVSTSNLTREQIDIWWHNFEEELQREGLHG